MKTMALEKPTNSKGYARLLLKHILSKVRDTGSLMPPMEYKALAVQIGFNDSQLAIALRELKRENWIALDNTTQGIRLTPDGAHTGDYWQYRAESVLLNDPLPDSLESVRIEMNHFGQELQGTQPRSSEWQWISARIEALRHQENVMTKEAGTSTYIKSGSEERLNERHNKLLVFISHSSQDQTLAEALIELLKSATGLVANQIRCSSVDGYRLPAGVNTEDRLREEVNATKVVVGLITPHSLLSHFVMFELGARWGGRLYLAPILAGVQPGELKAP
jgi:hypothetical protein